MRATSLDGLGVVPDRLQQGLEVNAVEQRLHFFLAVSFPVMGTTKSNETYSAVSLSGGKDSSCLYLPVLGDVLAVPAVQGHAGHGNKVHVLQQPQLIGAVRQHDGGAALVVVLVQPGGPLAEQVPAPVSWESQKATKSIRQSRSQVEKTARVF